MKIEQFTQHRKATGDHLPDKPKKRNETSLSPVVNLNVERLEGHEQETHQSLEAQNALAEAFSHPDKIRSLYDRVSKECKAFLTPVMLAMTLQSCATPDQLPAATESEAKKLEKVTGINIVEMARSVGMEAYVNIFTSDANGTIIHLGQKHTADDDPKKNVKDREWIRKSQDQINHLLYLLSGAERPVKNAFLEGHDPEVIQELETLKVAKGEIETLSVEDREGFGKKIVEISNKVFAQQSNPWLQRYKIVMLNYLFADKLEDLGFTEVSPLQFQDSSGATVQLPDSGLFPPDNKTIGAVEQALMHSGAALLFLDGDIQVLSTKSAETDRIFGNFIQGMRKNGKRMQERLLELHPLERARIENMQDTDELANSDVCKKDEVCQTLAQRVLDFGFQSNYLREKTAIDQISANAKASGEMNHVIYPLVFGVGHDYTYAVSEHNKQEEYNSNKYNANQKKYKFNLITIRDPKSFLD